MVMQWSWQDRRFDIALAVSLAVHALLLAWQPAVPQFEHQEIVFSSQPVEHHRLQFTLHSGVLPMSPPSSQPLQPTVEEVAEKIAPSQPLPPPKKETPTTIKPTPSQKSASHDARTVKPDTIEPAREVAQKSNSNHDQPQPHTQQAEPSPTSAPTPVGRQTAIASAAPALPSGTAEHPAEAHYRKRQAPQYPPRSIALGQQGLVILHARVDPKGYPQTLKVAESSGHNLLDRAAMAAVRQWLFEPLLADGVAVAGWIRVPVEFRLQGERG